jgi:hypothetical protein
MAPFVDHLLILCEDICNSSGGKCVNSDVLSVNPSSASCSEEIDLDINYDASESSSTTHPASSILSNVIEHDECNNENKDGNNNTNNCNTPNKHFASSQHKKAYSCDSKSKCTYNKFESVEDESRDQWSAEETIYLETLVDKFKDKNTGRIRWQEMEFWLKSNKNIGDKKSCEPNIIKTTHIDKEKLRSKWKNELKLQKK